MSVAFIPSALPQTLPAARVTTVRLHTARLLRVQAGRLWVTCAGDETDYFVHAGQTLALAAGCAVLEADGGADARYRFDAPAPTDGPRRAGWLARWRASGV